MADLKKIARDLEGKVQRRECLMVVRQIDEKRRTVELAFASEAPIERFFGIEILAHAPGAVRLERLNAGGALLVNHHIDDQVGAVVKGSARIDADRVSRATVRLGRGVRATEIFNDISDEIRTLVSVAYVWHKIEVTEGEANAPDTIRVLEWEPLEISIVSIPADLSVGVGREYIPGSGNAATPPLLASSRAVSNPLTGDDDMAKTNTAPPPRAKDDDVAPEAGRDAGQDHHEQVVVPIDRTAIDASLRAVGQEFECAELAEEHVKLARSVDELQAAIARKLSNVYAVPVAPDPAPPGLPRTESRLRYKTLEGFASEELAYRSGMWVRATLFGDVDALRWCKDAQVRVLTSEEFAKGGALVPAEMSQAIIDLREHYGVARRVCKIWPMASDTLTIQRRTGGVTAYFVGQKEATTASDKAWDSMTLTARELSALTLISMALAEDATIDIAADLAKEMAWAFAKKEDECLFDGDGTSTYGGIQGLRSKIIDGTHTAGAVDGASGHDTIGEMDAEDLDSVRAALPEFADANPIWVMSKVFKNLVPDAITRAAGGNTLETLAGRPRSTYLGDEIVVAQAMPKGVGTDYSNVAMAFYGDFQMACALGDRRGFAIQVLRERYAEYRQIGVLGFQRFDINVHDLGDNTDAGPVVGLIGE